jgi:hypothetical protein
MKLIATIVDLLLRVAAVASLGIFVFVYLMVGFMAGPIGIIFIVVPPWRWAVGSSFVPACRTPLLRNSSARQRFVFS